MIYDYAEGEADGEWGGDFKLCVERPGPFKRIDIADYTCNEGLLEGFGETDITGECTTPSTPDRASALLAISSIRVWLRGG